MASTKLQRSLFQHCSQGSLQGPPGDLSYFWERSEVTFQAEGKKEGGELADSEGWEGSREPGGLIFPVPEGGVFLLRWPPGSPWTP